MPQSQTAALPRPQEEEETDNSKQAQTEQTHEKHQDQPPPSPSSKRGNRNTKRTEKHKNKMTHGKTHNKSPCRINHKATRSKTNTGTTALERSTVYVKFVSVSENLSSFAIRSELMKVLRSSTLTFDHLPCQITHSIGIYSLSDNCVRKTALVQWLEQWIF